MPLADVDWVMLKEIVTTIAQVLTLALVTIGTAWGIYIGYRTKALEMGQKKQGRTNRRRFKKLLDETVGQTGIMKEVQTQTNGMRREAEERAHREGKAVGVAEGVEKAKEVAEEVAKKVASQIVPVPVTVTNPEPIQVHDTGEPRTKSVAPQFREGEKP